MLSVLVVEDEPRSRKGIINLIKELRPEYIINGSKNGEEALKFIELNNVDILITDIKMPIMDGLQLTKIIVENKKNIKIIIISAYDYFDYAQQAIRIGVFDYLIKPVDKVKVINTIFRVEDKIKNERLKLDEKEKLLNEISNAMSIYTQTKLNKWLDGDLDEHERDEIECCFPYKGRGCIILCFIEDYKEQIINCTTDEIQEIMINVKYWLNDLIKPYGNFISFYIQGDNVNIKLVTVLNVYDDFTNNNENFTDKMYELINIIRSQYNVESAIGISKIYENINENLKKAYEEASIAINYKFYFGSNKIINYLNIESSYKKQQFKKLIEEDALIEAFIKLDCKKAIEIMGQIIDKLIEKEYPYPKFLIDKIINIMVKLAETIEMKMVDENYTNLILNMKDELANCKQFQGLNKKCEQLLLNLLEIQKRSDNNKTVNSIVMEKCIEYININYKCPISLEQIAAKFYFNSSYFSSYFKNYTGVNFSQYVLKLRLKKAIELLENTNLKIYEISEKVGYTDSKYFIRIFKNQFRVSPEEYRRLKFGGLK